MKKRYRSLERLGRTKKTLIFSLILCIITGALAFASQLFAARLFGWESTVIRLETELEFMPYLNLSVTNIPLYVHVYDGDTIKIAYVNETELIIEKTDYSYTLSQDPGFAFSLFAAEQLSYKFDIYLPNELYHEISISTASGDVAFSEINVEELYINGRSSNINIEKSRGGVTAKTFNGSIYAEFSELSDNAHLESMYGNVTAVFSPDNRFNVSFYTEKGSIYTDLFPENDKYNNKRTTVDGGKLTLTKGISANTLNVYTTDGNFSLLSSEHDKLSEKE